MKRLLVIIGTLLLIFALATCSAASDQAPAMNSAAAPAAATGDTVTAGSASPAIAATAVADVLSQVTVPHATALVDDTAASTSIMLAGDAITVDGPGVTVEGSRATITAAGVYRLSGQLSDGQIVVATEDEAAVQLILDGVDLRSSSSAPLYVRAAAATVIVLADGAQNYLADGAAYVFADAEDDEPNAALFSKADLTITGAGALTVQGNYNDGIASKDGLVISGGAITVSAVDDGIRGKDYLVVEDGALIVTAQGDGLKSDNEDDASVGYILVEGGTLAVNAGGDALTAQSDVLITGGEFALTSGGGSAATIDEALSAKGIKAARGVQIDGGVFAIDSADDAIHANDSITVDGGVFTIATGDDGLHADNALTINDGALQIVRSYEGIESTVITLNGGDIHIVASDDGVNVAGGVDGSGLVRGARPQGMQPGGRPPGGQPGASGQDAAAYTGDNRLYIHGGNLVVDADGDGLDANGAIIMTGGTVIVNGPTMNMNGALDYDAGFNIDGGFLAAAGSAGMVQAPGSASTQNVLLLTFSATQPAGTLVHIADSQGNAVLTFAPAKDYQALVFSAPALVSGASYTVYSGGSASGVATDGLYAGGAYTPGVAYTSFTVDGVVTVAGGAAK